MEILASHGVQFLVSSEGKVPLSSIEGKKVCIFFSANWCRPCKSFTPQLSNLYHTIRKDGEDFEIIFVSFDRDQDGFEKHFKNMPWLGVPFDMDLHRRLSNFYKVSKIPSFLPISGDGEEDEDLIEEDCVGFIEDYGVESFPFTKKRRDELKAIDDGKLEGGSLEQLLGFGGRNGLVSRDGEKVMVSKLNGKIIGLYFGANWSPPCRTFTTQLIEAYNELNTKPHQKFEVIFVSTDRDKQEFNTNLTTMPWLAIPYEEKTRKDLCRIFKVEGIPTLVIMGENGKPISKKGRELIYLYGAKGYPFTDGRLLEIERALIKEGDELPREVDDSKHEHVLKLEMARAYVCDYCNKQGRFWAFSCHACDYDLHPRTCVHGKS